MFDSLQGKLQEVFRRLRAEGRISSEQLQRALREIRLALLEADVHVRVVRSFIERVQERALGEVVWESLTPDQQILKIVRDELTDLLGEEGAELELSRKPTVILLCGLQGCGKTTTAGKLGHRLLQSGRRSLLVAADLQRAAAVEQLSQVGDAVGVPVLKPQPDESVMGFGSRALEVAGGEAYDVVIIDTAGRLHVDQSLMEELQSLARLLDPGETLLVSDAMTGQDAVRSAGEFARAIRLSGVVLTKLDGDARGGAALSIRSVTELPIRFAGVGEKMEDLELFHPQRMASRILGMGDVMSLIEKAEKALDRGESERLAQRIAKREFTLEDLRDQLRQIRRLGPLSQVLEMLPQAGPLKGLDPSSLDESRLTRVEAIVNSMTPEERRRPTILNASRRRRVARGSGTTVQEINQLVKQYRTMRRMMKKVRGKWMRGVLEG